MANNGAAASGSLRNQAAQQPHPGSGDLREGDLVKVSASSDGGRRG